MVLRWSLWRDHRQSGDQDRDTGATCHPERRAERQPTNPNPPEPDRQTRGPRQPYCTRAAAVEAMVPPDGTVRGATWLARASRRNRMRTRYLGRRRLGQRRLAQRRTRRGRQSHRQRVRELEQAIR